MNHVLSENNQAETRLAELERVICELYYNSIGFEPLANETPVQLLRRGFNFLSDIVHKMPAHIYWLDRNNVFLGCNELQAKNVGLSSPKEIRGKKIAELVFSKETVRAVDELNIKVMETKKTYRIEEFGADFLHPQGGCYLSEKTPLLDPDTGEVIGVLGVSIDITDRKEMESALKQAKNQEEELRNAVTMFAGSIAHDLRTPLAIQSMKMGILETKIEKMIESCKQADIQSPPMVEQLEKLLTFPQDIRNMTKEMNLYINDTLKALEKTVSGVKTAEDLVNCSLWKCLQKAIKSYPCTEDDRQKIHWDRSVDFDFMGNPIFFHRVMSNLLKNAFEQIEQQGQGEIYICAKKTEQFNQLIIKDTAGHVTEELIQQLFKGYKTTKKEGTGIGLVFCKSVMESFGGDIACQLVDSDKIEFCLSFQKN